MSQPSVTAYFNTRKRQGCDELRAKSKILLLERDNRTQTSIENLEKSPTNTATSPKIVLQNATTMLKEGVRANKAVRNIQFDSSKAIPEKTNRPRIRATRSRPLPSMDGSQADIRDSFMKVGNDSSEIKNVPFEKKGTLSPKKSQTPKKTLKDNAMKETEKERSANGSLTPSSSRKLSTMERFVKNDNLNLTDIKNKINKSSRLAELKAITRQFAKYDLTLEQLQKQDEIKKPHMQKFEKVQLEIPVSPQKTYKSPTKGLLTPIKERDLSKTVSPQRQILFEPKETVSSPGKSSPVKAYQKYLSVAESGLALPYDYRFLAEIFRCIDTVSAMLFNRKELITFNKLRPAVQELLRRNFTQEHLAQIKTIYPDAYVYHQEKHRNFGSVSKQEKYELVLTPTVEKVNGRNTLDADNILKTASESSMSPTILLERRRKFYNALLERVKNEHEKFLLTFETPKLMNIPKEKIVRWHPEFDVESCKKIEQAALPQPPYVEKPTARDVLDKAKSLFNCGTRMEKALQRLAEANLTTKSKSSSPTQDSTTQTTKDDIPKINIAIVDIPPSTPSIQTDHFATLFKGIPKALLEKVRAKQAAKALEAMTRTPNADKEAALYSRLPELAKLIRNIFVAEKKGVLPLETVIQKLDNSFRTKLMLQEMEEHIRQLCKLLPTWASIHNVRKVDYLKLDKNVELAKVINRLEILANDKVKIAS
ncbi:PREDICTED: DNA replication factor Cdt1 [Trachymyrmex cornetzi]|uniref:DNA replication factor Cdt1 n=1 Tax=Trachymyrmex cornetzi TaxID=471704 RepID=A0A195DJ21_9HYME|nr:PREDICTED: DNA replication factor Cdt1 [Trachymyrmex cornetzi]KYN12817.1 DNA replication factor Cdt1 [Trachymyrmex cornetzi]